MSDMAKKARAAMKAKASKMTTADPHQKVDSSTWTPPDALNTEAKTGLRPISRRAFKKGGKVMGSKPKTNLGKATRGGNKPLTPDNFANKDVKAANEERAGIKHVGALKTGGRAKKQSGGKNMILDSRTPQPSPENMPLTPEMERRMQSIMDADARKSREYEARDRAKRDYEVTGQKRGGRTGKAGGGAMAGAQKMLQQAQQTAGVPSATLGFTGIKKGSLSPARGVGLKKGGTAKHDDVKQDMALIKKMVKPEARKGRDGGGRLPTERTQYEIARRKADAEAAAREEKIKDLQEKNYKTYFDETDRMRDTYGDQGEDMWKARKAGGKAKRKGRDGGGRLAGEATRMAQADRKAYDALKGAASADRGKALEAGLKWYKADSDANRVSKETGYDRDDRKSGGRTARKEGGGVFSGPGYPGKVPGVTGGREAHATRGRVKTADDIAAEYAMRGPDEAMQSIVAGGLPPHVAKAYGLPITTEADRGLMNSMYDDAMQQMSGSFDPSSFENSMMDSMPRRNGGRAAHAKGGKTKGKGKTNINIVIAAGKPANGQDMMGMPPGMDAGPKGMPVPVPPPGGAGMPMGGGAPMPMPPMPMPAGPAAGPAPMPRKAGGRLMAKASSYKDMTAGSGGGEGRLQKTDIAKKHKDAPAFKAGGKVYKSYKDMDAGSGSGMGRLEKTEIQKRKG